MELPDEAARRGQVSALLAAWTNRDAGARDALLPVVYDELRRLAQHYMRDEREGHTLQATALVNEAYLRLVGLDRMQWRDRAHFFAMAATLMRRVLVDHARERGRDKRGGGVSVTSLDDHIVAPRREVDVVALDEALERLAVLDARQSQIVELRFFGGLSVEETAEALGISPATVKREWASAKAWLYQQLSGA
jgi:RNA polymerase sigma factor (TIGR02999 family)